MTNMRYLAILMGKVHVAKALLLSCALWNRVAVLDAVHQNQPPCNAVRVYQDPIYPFRCVKAEPNEYIYFAATRKGQ